MASDPLIDVPALIQPIPGEDPAGEPVAFDVRKDLEKLRKEITAEDTGSDESPRPPDWSRLIRVATQTLADKSKDLLVAARLTEALTQQHGFAGLADGVGLLRALTEQCWDRIFPLIEDGDLEVRAGPFNWLAEADRGAYFPHTVRSVPLVPGGPDGGFGWAAWRSSQDGKGASKEEFDRAVTLAPREYCQATVDHLTRAMTDLMAVGQDLNGKLGPDAPGMSDLRSALGDCLTLAKQILQTKGPAPVAAGEGDADETGAEPGANGTAPGGSGAGGGGGDARAVAGRAIATRAELYRRLTDTAAVLEQIEPHSPIPYLVRKAIDLGALPFPLLMKALIRDESVLTDLNRELGIKEPPPE